MYREIIKKVVSGHRMFVFITCIIGTAAWYMAPREIGMLNLLMPECIVLFLLWLSFAISVKSRMMDNRFMHYFGSVSMEMYLAQMVLFRVIDKLNLLYVFGQGWMSFIFVFILEIVLLVVFIEGYKWMISIGARQRI